VRTETVVESIDIEAPPAELFATVIDTQRRFQLNPRWGIVSFQDISADFPQAGSHYRVRVIDGGEETGYDTIVTEYAPLEKFAYRITAERGSWTIWTFEEIANGTRLVYREEFSVEDADDEAYVQSVRQDVTEWLGNLKRYAELRGGWWQPIARWGVDRFLLPLKGKQRRVICMLLAWEAVGCLSFLVIGLGWGVASLLGLI